MRQKTRISTVKLTDKSGLGWWKS